MGTARNRNPATWGEGSDREYNIYLDSLLDSKQPEEPVRITKAEQIGRMGLGVKRLHLGRMKQVERDTPPGNYIKQKTG